MSLKRHAIQPCPSAFTSRTSYRKRRFQGSEKAACEKRPGRVLHSCSDSGSTGSGFWGKKREAAWQRGLRDHGGYSGHDPWVMEESHNGSRALAILLHPVAHLAWTSLRRKGDDGMMSVASEMAHTRGHHQEGGVSGPAVCDFGVANSAMCTMALPVDWAEVDQLAATMESSLSYAGRSTQDPVASTPESQIQDAYASGRIAKTFLQPETGWWQVADTQSLQLVLAHALLDKPIVAVCSVGDSEVLQGIELDRRKLWCEDSLLMPEGVPGQRCTQTCDEEPGTGIADGITDIRRLPGGSSSKMSCMCDPSAVSHTRWEEACCWPKVWALRQVLRKHGAKAWDKSLTDQGVGLGSVPIKWSAERRSWTAGNRHRAVASLLAGQHFQATFKRKQVIQWEWRQERDIGAGVDEQGCQAVKWPAVFWQPDLLDESE